MVTVLDLQLKGCGFDPQTFHIQVTTLDKLFAHMPLSPSSTFGTSQGAVIPYGWEGNRRSGVALVMHHRLSDLSTYTFIV